LPSQNITWSDWLNFDKENIGNVPPTPGIFRMHESMKILIIENTNNLQKRLFEALEDTCTANASRFCYFETAQHEQLKNDLIKEYTEKHDGKLPKCM
jgi:hypothetical protein